MAKYKTKADMERAFQTSGNTVSDWTKRHDFPGGSNGPWDHDKVATYLDKIGSPIAPNAAQNRHKNNGVSTVQAATAAARALKLKEEHRKLKLQNDILEGQLVYRELVERNATRFAVQIKNRLESIPEQMEMLFPTDIRRELSDEVAEHIRGVLLEMSRWDAFEDQ